MCLNNNKIHRIQDLQEWTVRAQGRIQRAHRKVQKSRPESFQSDNDWFCGNHDRDGMWLPYRRHTLQVQACFVGVYSVCCCSFWCLTWVDRQVTDMEPEIPVKMDQDEPISVDDTVTQSMLEEESKLAESNQKENEERMREEASDVICKFECIVVLHRLTFMLTGGSAVRQYSQRTAHEASALFTREIQRVCNNIRSKACQTARGSAWQSKQDSSSGSGTDNWGARGCLD